MAGPGKTDEKREESGKPLTERLRDLVGAVLDGLQEMLNPPRPVRVPVGARRPR